MVEGVGSNPRQTPFTRSHSRINTAGAQAQTGLDSRRRRLSVEEAKGERSYLQQPPRAASRDISVVDVGRVLHVRLWNRCFSLSGSKVDQVSFPRGTADAQL